MVPGKSALLYGDVGSSRTCAGCLQVRQRVEQDAGTGGKTVRCFAGRRIGRARAGGDGQPTCKPAGDAERAVGQGFRSTLAQLEKWKAVDAAARRVLRQYCRRPLRRGAAVAGEFLQHLSLLSNELMIDRHGGAAGRHQRGPSSPSTSAVLTKSGCARRQHERFISAGFKAATGLTFTNYVARARIEKTKRLLLNHVRIEAAYEAGFQSLSQFSRIFRRVVGGADDLSGPPPRLRARPSHAMAFAA